MQLQLLRFAAVPTAAVLPLQKCAPTHPAGEVRLPYVSEENHDEDPELQVVAATEGPAAQRLKTAILASGKQVGWRAGGSLGEGCRGLLMGPSPHYPPSCLNGCLLGCISA